MSEPNVSTYSFNIYFEIKFLFNDALETGIFNELSSAKVFVKSALRYNHKILTIVCYFQATTGKSDTGLLKIPNKRFTECAFDEDEFLEISQNLIDGLWGKAKEQIDDYMNNERDGLSRDR